MPSSYRLVNYAVRPAKASERKILCDLLRRLEPFARINTYQYVGFGSIYFSDFQLFHQNLGISDMVSIEKETSAEGRFEFNRPYRCVDLKMGHSNVILPQLPWDRRAVVWLDYDGKLDGSVLADIGTVAAKALSGTLLLISLNVEPERKPGAPPEETDRFRLDTLRDAVGTDRVPADVSGAHLRSGDFAKTCRRIVYNELSNELADRNGPLPPEERLIFKPLVFISYADEAQMATFGGLIYRATDAPLVEQCGFNELDFIRTSDVPYELKAPKLTPKEVRHLNALLPKTQTGRIALTGVPQSDVENYASIYRYYPSFGEIFLG